MEEKKERHATFSSSNVYRLVGLGSRPMTAEEKRIEKEINPKSRKRVIKHKDTPDDKFYTYVKEKRREKKLKRAISSKSYTRAIIWGHVCELYVFAKKLDTSYSDMNNIDRLSHPNYPQWTGIPDTFKRLLLIVGDIKSPSSLIKFCDLIENFEESIASFKDNHEDFYWQLVSNAILTGVDKAELIFFIPYLSELKEIGEFVSTLEEEDLPLDLELFQIEWITHEINAYTTYGKKPLSIPYLPDDCEYKDFNQYEFEVPQIDKEFLTERVKMAIELLNK